MSDGNGALPEGWVKSTIGDVAKIVTGKTPSTKRKEYHGGDIPFVKPGDLDRDVGLSTSETYVTELGATQAPRLPPSTVLVSCIGNLGKVTILERDAICNQQINAILPNDAMESRFTFHWAKTIRSWMQENASATTVTILNKGRFEGAPVPLPPLPEQGRIVSKIESLQARSSCAREALNEVDSLLDQFRQSVLQAAFTGRLTADWRAAHPDVEPASELLEQIRTERRERWEQAELAKYEAKGKKPPKNFEQRYKAPPPVSAVDLPKLPDSWAWGTVDELTELITSGSRAWKKYYDKGDGTFIMAQNIRPGRLDFSQERQLVGPPPEPDSDRKRSQVEPGDLLVTIVGANTGDICPVEEELPEHWVCQSVALLRLVLPEMHGLVLRYFLPGSEGRVRFDKLIYGQGRPHLGFDDLRAIPVPIPPLEEQSVLLRVIAGREESINTVENILFDSESSLTQLDQSILAKAFRGELVPQDPNDEPASELLARIRATREQAKATTKKKSKKKRKTASSK